MLAELQPARLNFTVMSTLIGNLCCSVLWLLLRNHLIVGDDLAPLNFENSRTLRRLPLTSRLILLAIGEANDLQFLNLTKRIAAPSYGSVALSNNFVKNLRHDLAGYLMPLLLLQNNIKGTQLLRVSLSWQVRCFLRISDPHRSSPFIVGLGDVWTFEKPFSGHLSLSILIRIFSVGNAKGIDKGLLIFVFLQICMYIEQGIFWFDLRWSLLMLGAEWGKGVSHGVEWLCSSSSNNHMRTSWHMVRLLLGHSFEEAHIYLLLVTHVCLAFSFRRRGGTLADGRSVRGNAWFTCIELVRLDV